jgi:hypothetical protein
MLTRITILSLWLATLGCFMSLAEEHSAHAASNCKDWKAWLNLMPGTAPPSLHITGTCQFPTAGYSVELIPVSRKGSGQKQFMVQKVVHKPEGMAAQVITDVPVNDSKETTVQYETVVITPDKVKVPVERAGPLAASGRRAIYARAGFAQDSCRRAPCL